MNKTKVMAWFIVVIMVLSVLGIVGSSFFSEEERRPEYNRFDFAKVNNQWLLKINDKDYYFQYLPQELENITSPPAISLDIPKIYLAYRPKDIINYDKAISSMGYVLYHHHKILLQKACAEEKDCPDIPIINCQEKPGIVILSGEENSYTQDEKCLRITAADNEKLQKLTERLIYKLLGVMN